MGFENLKEMLPKFKKEEPQQKEPPQEDDDERNDVTHMRAKEPIIKGLKRKYVYYGIAAFIAITLIATTLGLQEDESRKAEKEAAAQNDLRNSQAVEGDHLLNIPKDYKAQADAEAKRKAEEEAKKKAEDAAKEAEAKKKAREAAKVPDAPRVPQQPSRYTGRNELSPAEKARLAREERRMQALESPIGFEIQNKD